MDTYYRIHILEKFLLISHCIREIQDPVLHFCHVFDTFNIASIEEA